MPNAAGTPPGVDIYHQAHKHLCLDERRLLAPLWLGWVGLEAPQCPGFLEVNPTPVLSLSLILPPTPPADPVAS